MTSPRSGHRIAIIGAGPAGLACAHDLVLLGHSPTVFDRRTEPGGTLAHLIPPSRFPRQSVRAEAAAILGMGVEFRREHGIQGPDAFLTLLDEGYDAIFLAIGTPRARTLDLPGIGDITAVPIDAVAVLSGEASPIGDVIVVGDDDLALDAAIVLASRPAAPEGRETGVVHLALSAAEGPLRARSGLMSRAARAGVVVHLGWAPAGISDETDGRVTVRLYRDGAADRLVCANAIVHAGRRDVGRVFGSAIALRSDGLIETDPETLRTSHRRVWAGGACAFGHRSIAHAVADGKRAAWEIHGAITGGTIRIDVAFEWVEVGPDPLERAALSLRTHRALDTMQPTPTDPFNGEVTAQRAAHVLEAARCFDCTIVPMVDERCTRCGKCVSACPVGAFALTTGEEPQLTLDQSMCTRCGICVSACPEGAVAMVRGVWEARLVQSSRGEQLEHHPGDGARVALTVIQ